MDRLPESVTVLDASALICLARREPAWEKVAAFGLLCEISAVNLVEVAYRLTSHGIPMADVEPLIRPMIGRVVPFDQSQSLIAASIHKQTREHGISLADCAALALAMSRQATIVTADRKWKSLCLDLNIVQIR